VHRRVKRRLQRPRHVVARTQHVEVIQWPTVTFGPEQTLDAQRRAVVVAQILVEPVAQVVVLRLENEDPDLLRLLKRDGVLCLRHRFRRLAQPVASPRISSGSLST